MAHSPTGKRDNSFLSEGIAEMPDGQRLRHCMQCGSCAGSCPNGADMDYTPRSLIAMVAAGERDKVLSAGAMWYCVSCYACTSRCPQSIPVTDFMYALKRISLREGKATTTDAPALATTFTGLLDRYGRSFELGLASRYYLFNKPLSMLKMGPLGLRMFTRGRMSLRPSRIRQVEQLRAIIDKARELGGAE